MSEREHLSDVLDRLASVVPNGELLLATSGADLLEAATARIVELEDLLGIDVPGEGSSDE